MERRRKRAAVMFEKGDSAAEVARRVGVSRQAATRWKGAWLQGGSPALVSNENNDPQALEFQPAI